MLVYRKKNYISTE